MTHNGTFHNPAIGGVWALQQAYNPTQTHSGQVISQINTYANDIRFALGLDYVTGFCYRVPWNRIENETVQGDYDFFDLEAALSIVREFPGKKFAVRPIFGGHTPSYVFTSLGARGYVTTKPSVNGRTAPHPCNTNGTPNTIWINRALPFMDALIDWAASKGGDVPYIHGSHFSEEFSEFFHGPIVRTPTTGYDAGNVNFINAHKLLWEGVYDLANAAGIATEFGMSGTHVEDIQIAAVEYLHTLIPGDYDGGLIINANGEAGTISGGTDWGSSTSETQQDGNCGFAVNGVFNPPVARRVSRMAQMIQPGAYSASYWHNVFLSVRANRMEGVEIYLGDGSPVGAPGKSFSTASSGNPLGIEARAWLAEITGSPPTQATATVISLAPAFTQSASAHRWVSGSAASNLPSFVQAASAQSNPPAADEATATSVLPSFTQAATGERGENTAAATSTLPAFAQTAAVVRDVVTAGTAVASSVLPSFTQAAVGVQTLEAGEAAVTNTLPAFTSSTDAALEPQAEVADVMPAFISLGFVDNRHKRYGHPVSAIPAIDGTGLILPNRPPRRPELIMQGLVDRDSSPDDTSSQPGWGGLHLTGNYVKGFVLNVNHADLQPNAPDETFVSTAIDDAIQEATDLGITLKVRCFFGQHAAQWMKDIGGGPITLTLPQPPNTVATVPAWWEDLVQDAQDQFWTQFIDRYNDFCGVDGPLREVVLADCMTFFAEPDLHQTGQETIYHNREFGYIPAGYTLDADLAAQRAAIDRRLPMRCVSSRACNPYQVCNSPANNVSFTIGLIKYARKQLGLYFAPGNNSIRTAVGFPTAKYQQIYDEIAAKGAPSYFQTAATSRVGNLYLTCLSAVSYGATMIELPGSTFAYTNTTEPTGMSPDQFDEINEALAANAAAIGY